MNRVRSSQFAKLLKRLPSRVAKDNADFSRIFNAIASAWLRLQSSSEWGNALVFSDHSDDGLDQIEYEFVQAAAAFIIDATDIAWLFQWLRARQQGLAQRSHGVHYTPLALGRKLLDEARFNDSDLEGKWLDPACGCGAILLEAANYLTTAKQTRAWNDDYYAKVLEDQIYGRDIDAKAVEVARWLLSKAGRFTVSNLSVGDSLLDDSWLQESATNYRVIISNPPWVAYAGRAASPLTSQLRQAYEKRFESFRSYPTLHGCFSEDAARCLDDDGRLALVVPTSVADLDGYKPLRTTLVKQLSVDPWLPDFGDREFDGVFQPSMFLLARKRPHPPKESQSSSATLFSLRSERYSPKITQLLQRLLELPSVPESSFAERGFQSTGADRSQLLPYSENSDPPLIGLRAGGDITEFRQAPPLLGITEDFAKSRLRNPSEFPMISVVVRQTARFIIAAPNDGLPFRNSLLAAYSDELRQLNAWLLYLNSRPLRWLHYHRFRDARQGMPQVKLKHLRAIPDLETASWQELAQISFAHNTKPVQSDLVRAEEIIYRSWGIQDQERESIIGWYTSEHAQCPRWKRAEQL